MVALLFFLVFNTSAIVIAIVIVLITCVREERFGLSFNVIFRAIVVYLAGDVSILIEANNFCIQGFVVILACWLDIRLDIREAVGGAVVGGAADLALSSLVALCLAILVHL